MAAREREKRIALCLFLLGLAARLGLFGAVPGGLNQDEAFAAYEAWSLLHHGIDSAGKPWPVYLTAWGSGMNALESYLMIPFIALFGLQEWVIRLPQVILACLSLLCVYAMTREWEGEEAALWMLGLTAICPWHIMLSRWALESNLAPAFLLFGMYFFLKGMKRGPYLLLSALMYGLALYCYASIWPVMPPLLLAQLLYGLLTKKMKGSLWLLPAFLLLALLALPLLLFLGVNYGWLEECRLGIFTIPKLLAMRSEEISLQNVGVNLQNLAQLLRTQSDGLFWNHGGSSGLLYYLSVPFCVLGFLCILARLPKGKGSPLQTFMLLQFLAALALGMLIRVNVNRINILFFPLLFFTALGIRAACSQFRRPLRFAVAGLYLLLFLGFGSYYFGEHADTIRLYFNDGLDTALASSAQKGGSTYLDDGIYYSQVLFYDQTDPKDFAETVVYRSYPSPYLKAERFGRFVFQIDPERLDPEGCYILSLGRDLDPFLQEGYRMESHGAFILAYKGR